MTNGKLFSSHSRSLYIAITYNRKSTPFEIDNYLEHKGIVNPDRASWFTLDLKLSRKINSYFPCMLFPSSER